ncbi:MAG: phosphate ABC transporter permease PstA [Pseudobdellovibrionaceae bacterium]
MPEVRSEMLQEIKTSVSRRKTRDFIFAVCGMMCLIFALMTLLVLIFDLASTGVPRLTMEFFTSFPSRKPEQAGILSAWVGTLLIMLVTAVCAIPLGIAAGVYLEEYASKNWMTAFIELNITNLAAVPSITFGLMALGIFVYKLQLGQSILTAGLTLGLLVLPIVIVATREALRAIPQNIREASFALGASQWQTVKDHLLPYSSGGILTGVIIALSRAIGETAPLITIGALTFIAFLPQPPLMAQPPYFSMQWLFDSYTVMPIQMFNWVSRPQPEFHVNSAAAGIVLLGMTLMMNAVAIFIRYRFRKGIQW